MNRPVVRRATPAEVDAAARMLHDFNREYDLPSPGPDWLARRLRELMRDPELVVLLAGEPACGLAVVRFRPALWSEGTDAYLEELYVRPERRGRGLGRALLEATIELSRERDAAFVALNTSEADTAARALYESAGFTNLEQGSPMYYYELELED
jgi:ribosomal protein S18 acetylase RimI-like enzyme